MMLIKKEICLFVRRSVIYTMFCCLFDGILMEYFVDINENSVEEHVCARFYRILFLRVMFIGKK